MRNCPKGADQSIWNRHASEFHFLPPPPPPLLLRHSLARRRPRHSFLAQNRAEKGGHAPSGWASEAVTNEQARNERGPCRLQCRRRPLIILLMMPLSDQLAIYETDTYGRLAKSRNTASILKPLVVLSFGCTKPKHWSVLVYSPAMCQRVSNRHGAGPPACMTVLCIVCWLAVLRSIVYRRSVLIDGRLNNVFCRQTAGDPIYVDRFRHEF